MRILTYVEIDIKQCTLTYGTAPCAAALGVTGAFKCYNSPKTCQDTANFNAGTLTLRFAKPTDYLPDDIECIPNIASVSVRPQIIYPGESMGERESVTVSFDDHLHSDAGIDKYLADRPFDTYNTGTFWSKFKARWPFIQGNELRLIRGVEGDDFADMEVRHYVIESTTGPDASGNFTITAKDVLKLLDGKKAKAPLASEGRLAAAITASDTALTLEPAGIGNSKYPAAGVASINEEVVRFTRSGDTITLTERGVNGATVLSGATSVNLKITPHDEGETFQLGIEYDGEDAADILNDLISNYTEVDAATYIDLPAWKLETETYIGRLFSAIIAKPTDVRDLVNELINSVGLVMYSDIINKRIVLLALRQFSALSEINDDVMIKGSLKIKEQQEKRVSQAWLYYGMRDPLEDLEERKNYKSILATPFNDSVAALEERPESIREVFSRWITVFNRPAADAANDMIVRRYGNAPRLFTFQLPLDVVPVLASSAQLSSRSLQDAQGFTESPELLRDPEFDNAAAWTLDTPSIGGEIKIEDGKLIFEDVAGTSDTVRASATITTMVAGAEYSLSIYVSEFMSAAASFQVLAVKEGASSQVIIRDDTTGLHAATFTATDNFDKLIIRKSTPSSEVMSATFDSISLKATDYDASVPVQIISVDKGEARYNVMAEEMTFVQEAVTDRVIIIDQDAFNINIREIHDSIYNTPESGDNVIVTIESHVTVGSTGFINPALDIGDWPAGVTITLNVKGRVQGAGGKGGNGSISPTPGMPGGTAIYSRAPITIDNATGQIYGGGGGGGGGFFVYGGTVGGPLIYPGAGGGGAGTAPGAAGLFSNSPQAQPGNANSGGSGGGSSGVKQIGGDGGDPGQPGNAAATGFNYNGAAGGAAGNAVDGESYVTYTNVGDIQGPRVN